MDNIEVKMFRANDPLAINFGGPRRVVIRSREPEDIAQLNVLVCKQIRTRLADYCKRNNHSQSQFVEKVIEWHLNYLEVRENGSKG